jgi:hypothetical protein
MAPWLKEMAVSSPAAFQTSALDALAWASVDAVAVFHSAKSVMAPESAKTTE